MAALDSGEDLVRPIFGSALFVTAWYVMWCAVALGQSQMGRPVKPADSANPLPELMQGEDFLPAAIRAQQADDFDNPAYPLVEAGEIGWAAVEGNAGKSCQDCHGGGARNALLRIAATFPKYAPDARQVITLSQRVNLCRQNNMKAPQLPEDSVQMTAITAYLRWLSRGTPSEVDITGPNAPVFERGRQIYESKLGLLQISCAQCHNQNFGHKFGAQTLSQGHPLAYPAFVTGLGRVVTLHERFRMCNKLARAEPQGEGSPDYVALELYISWRSKDLPITAPGVRQ